MLISGVDNGWSAIVLSLLNCRILLDFRPVRKLGVTKEFNDGEASLQSSSNEGIDSLDNVRPDMTDSWPVSLPAKSSSNNSSGGQSKRSSGLRPRDMLYSFSVTPVCCNIASTVNLCPVDRVRVEPPILWAGI